MNKTFKMSLLKNALSRVFKIDQTVQKQVLLAMGKQLAAMNKRLPWIPKAISRNRQDIKTWNEAQNAYYNADDPKTFALQLLYNEIRIDALLTSQIENRKNQLLGSGFSLKKSNGEPDEESTRKIQQSMACRILTTTVLDALYLGYSLVEIGLNETKELTVTVIPRTNVVPQTGLFYPDYTDDKSTAYRELPEFGKYILEFNSGDIGLLNKAVPHVLYKRFAQSCWSELCEIYGIPPRVLKTNTQDPALLNRAQQMMSDSGAAPWYVVDTTEDFSFASRVESKGEVYGALIQLCNNEISLLVSGAVIGQDTLHGSNNKDQSAQQMLRDLVKSDLKTVEQQWNTVILPALHAIGYLPADLTFSFDPAEDTEQLWKFAAGALPYYTISPDFIKEKFGIDVTGERQAALPAGQLKMPDFFD
jgi:phage gp29-like protein